MTNLTQRFYASATRISNGVALAAGVTYTVYSDTGGTSLASIASTSGGSAIGGSTKATSAAGELEFFAAAGTRKLYLRCGTQAGFGVQEISAYIADVAVILEPLTQGVVDAHAETGLYLEAGDHTLTDTIELYPNSRIFGDAAGGTNILGPTGDPAFNLAVQGGEYGNIVLKHLRITGGSRAVQSLDIAAYVTLEDLDLVNQTDASIVWAGHNEEWKLFNVRSELYDSGMSLGTDNYRVENTASGTDGQKNFDKNEFYGVKGGGAARNVWRIRCDYINTCAWYSPILNTAGQDSFDLDGGARGLLFANVNTEGGGQSGKNRRTTGSITSGTAALTVASGTGIANSDPITIAGAGASGADHTTSVLSGGGTTSLTLAANAVTTVSGAIVTTASYDDFKFAGSIAAPQRILFIGGAIGGEGTGGHLRYAINNPGYELTMVEVAGYDTIPVYDPSNFIRRIGGNILIRRPPGTDLAANTLTEDLTLASAKKLLFGTDTNLYRSQANVLKTDDNLFTVGNANINRDNGAAEVGIGAVGPGGTGAISINPQGGDTILHRAAAGIFGVTSALQFPERSDPSAPSSDNAILYVKDNGSGKTQLVVRFPTGAVQVIATEP